MLKIDEKEILGILREKYGVAADQAIRVRRKTDRQVWRIHDASGAEYALKFVAKGGKGRMIAMVNDYLHKKGIPVATVIPPLEGDASVPRDEGCFLLFPWLEGTHPDYTEPGMIEKMAKLLAEFHEASRGYAAAGYPIADGRYDWNRVYNRKIKKMERLRKMAVQDPDPFAQTFLDQYPWLRLRVDWVLDKLPDTALRRLLEENRDDPALGHGDYSHLNLLRDHRNELTVIDLDTVSTALPMRDISHLVTWINDAFGDWSRDRLDRVVHAYRETSPLTEEEYTLLLIDQIFPHRAIRLAEKYLEYPRNAALLQQFERCIGIDARKLNDLGMGPS
ncbi:phosphotransferase [Cohnella sp. CFH 77786]|uniref:phosphotransferase n=1 Tax=Cohnella sp. CFH 77786 TaxID=2662265 RepID=UPI001C60ED02|nr:phosphotransferase [Cohnella sp. CFH 77786]MBW5445363.1 phosphotransferase [Cohnella sp. CFH 77786]